MNHEIRLQLAKSRMADLHREREWDRLAAAGSPRTSTPRPAPTVPTLGTRIRRLAGVG